ncbi:MAG TPA: 3-isopropylmalate dehydrogenase [Candidatus Dormibacteraeota bacterium]|nr:3-isopropylmalate dehydrogenase [Candidatus Dormibacteraeota bacterium]
MARTVVVLPGDGIGPEVTEHAVAILKRACRLAGVEVVLERRLIGGAAIEAEGRPLSDETVAVCQAADAVLLGAVGGPQWDNLTGDMKCESGLLRLRKELGVFANLRPVKVHPALAQRSTLKPEVIEGVDMVVVRELTGGLYFGHPRGREGEGPSETARDSMVYTRAEIERVTRVAFELARSRRKKLTSVDKQNVLVTSRFWRDVVIEVAPAYPDVELEHILVDTAAMLFVRSPRDFDVVVTENTFGDILTDEAAMLTGSMGMLPSASLGEPGTPGLYEPIHGSAPDIAGQHKANPLGSILSVAMMLRSSLNLPETASAIEAAVDEVITAGILTPDLGGSATTADVADAVNRAFSRHTELATSRA